MYEGVRLKLCCEKGSVKLSTHNTVTTIFINYNFGFIGIDSIQKNILGNQRI